jgi:rod shape-determining protein MreC
VKNLLAFLIRHNFFFVFILLQVACVFLMVTDGGLHGSRVLNSSNEAVATLYSAAAGTKEYFFLKKENDVLASENALIRNLLKSNYNIIPLTEYEKRDTLYRQQYTYMSAKVVNSSVDKRRNFLTLNIGSDQGIGHDMAVMSPDGIVGIVTDVSQNFASVMSILHKDIKVNCELKRDGSYGPLIWDGVDYRYCLLTDIPTHAKIKAGDTVLTSELSGIFPQGIMVGTIVSYERKQNDAFYTVKVKLSTDLKKVNHVYVIKNKYKGERDSLEQATRKKQRDD